MKKPKPETDYWTAREAAAHLGLAASTVYNGGAGTREIPRVKFGRAPRWKKSDVIAFGERMHARAAARLVGRRRFPLAG